MGKKGVQSLSLKKKVFFSTLIHHIFSLKKFEILLYNYQSLDLYI